MDGDGPLPDGQPVNSMEVNDESHGELGAWDENDIEENYIVTRHGKSLVVIHIGFFVLPCDITFHSLFRF